DIEKANCFGESHEHGMSGRSFVAGIKLVLPLIKQFEGSCGVADFVPEVVRNPTISVNVVEVLAQTRRQKPGRNREVFVMRASQPCAVFSRVLKRRRGCRDRIARRKATPSEGCCGRRWVGELAHSYASCCPCGTSFLLIRGGTAVPGLLNPPLCGFIGRRSVAGDDCGFDVTPAVQHM